MLNPAIKNSINVFNKYVKFLSYQVDVSGLQPKDTKEPLIIEDLKRIYNKLFLLNLTDHRSLVAITGLQGAGKTRLLKRLYDFEEGILPEKLGRGERLPVFVTEKDVTSRILSVHQLVELPDGSFEIKEKAIDKDTFYKIAQNPKINEDLWLEVTVPFKHLHDPSKSFVLLPGFETAQNDISQHLLEYILRLSQSTIFVLQKDTFAQEDAFSLAGNIYKIYQNSKPIIAITFSELQPETNEAIKTQVKDLFGISDKEEDRIIHLGTSPELEEVWPDDLKSSVNKYCNVDSGSNKLLKKTLYDISNEIETITAKIDTLLEPKLNQKVFEERQHMRVLSSFEREINFLLNEVEKNVQNNLETRIQPAIKKFDGYLQKNVNWFSEKKIQFFGQNLKDLNIIRAALQDCWNEALEEENVINANTITPEKQIVETLYKIVNDKNDGLLNAPQQELVQDTPDIFGVIETPASNSLQRISSYFGRNENEVPQALKQNDYKALTLIGTQLLANSLETKAVQEAILEKDTEVKEVIIDLKPKDVDLMENFDKLSTISPKILQLIPVILGVDVALDGEPDILTTATAALGTIGIKLTSTQLLGIIGVGIGLAYTVKAIQEGMAGANQRQLQYSEIGKQVFKSLPSIQAKAVRSSLENIFDQMMHQLRERHLEISGVFDEVGELEQIKYSLRKVNQQCKLLKRDIYENTVLL